MGIEIPQLGDSSFLRDFFISRMQHHSEPTKTLPPTDDDFQNRYSCINTKSTTKLADPRILIIGGGISGLSAAYHLHLNGFKDVKLLEARNEIGGRTRTIEYEDGVLELGAQWIHGRRNNPVWNFAVANDIVDPFNPTVTGEGQGIYVTSKGDVIPTNIVEEVRQVIDEASDTCGDDIKNKNESDISHSSQHLSVEEHFRQQFNKYLNQSNDFSRNENFKIGLFNWHLTFHCLDNACNSLQDLSAAAWGEYIMFHGDRWVTIPSGYKEIIYKLASNLSETTIATNKQVTTIEWGNCCSRAYRQHCQNNLNLADKSTLRIICNSTTINKNESERTYQAKVTCSDGSSFGADHVIITTSLGFLKANKDTLFKPHLPLKKQQVISSMGFGTLNKIFLIFETAFWDRGTEGYQLVWTPDDDDFQVPEFKYHWYKDISGFDVLPNHSNILLCWIGKEGGEIMETLSDSDIIETLHKLLQHFLKKDIPRIIKVLRSQWHNDSFTKGSYSYRTIKMDENNCHTTDLANPILHEGSEFPLMQFAGEATETNYFSTVHGAFISGKREADLLIQFYQHQ